MEHDNAGAAPRGVTPRGLNHLVLNVRDIKFDRRVNHGMTHSLYIHDPNGYGIVLLYELPREVWEADIDGALNYAEPLPTEGAEALVDRTDGVPVFHRAEPAVP